MKNLLLVFFFSSIFLPQEIDAQTLLEINSNAFKTANEIRNGIDLNDENYSMIYQSYIEYESRLAEIANIEGKKSNTVFGNRKRAFQISLQKNIKEKLDSDKFDDYIKYTNQSDLTNIVERQKNEPIVSLNDDNKRKSSRQKLLPSSTVKLSEN